MRRPPPRVLYCVELDGAVDRTREVAILDGEVKVFGQNGVLLGSVADEPADNNSPSIAFAVENNFPNTAKVFSNDDNLEILYAIYPTYEYYTESVKKR